MTTDGWSACACSSQNPRTHPPPGDGGRADSQPQFISRSPRMTQAMKSGAWSGWSTRRRRARVHSDRSRVRSSGNCRSCRSGSVDWVVSAAGRVDDPRQARLLADGHGLCRSKPKQYAQAPNGKVPASRRAAAGLRPAVPPPLPKSPADWMHARGRFPQCSGTNAATPPIIGSPRFANSPSRCGSGR